MTRPHRLWILAYDGCQLLDVTGPAAVFSAANDAEGRKVYDLQIVSPDGGVLATNSGVALMSRRIGGQPDTLLVAGGSKGLRAVIARADVARWLQRVAPRAKRYGSVCTGAFVLAAAGLLDGKRVATHWASCDWRVNIPRSRSIPTSSTSSTARSGPRPASPPASTWRWPWSRPIGVPPRPT
jgi:transcriptional regulator GlxA family with amidase domain